MPVRTVTHADVTDLVEFAVRSKQVSSTPEEYRRHLTVRLEQPDIIAVVSEAAGRVNGFIVVSVVSAPYSAAAAPVGLVEQIHVEEGDTATWSALMVEGFRQATAHGVKELAIAAHGA